jgi:hypothetical protein
MTGTNSPLWQTIPGPNLKHETVDELEAIRLRIVAAAGMVC